MKVDCLDELKEMYPDMLTMDGFDDAIIGYEYTTDDNARLIYDYDKCIDIYISDGMTLEQAEECFDYNVIGSINRNDLKYPLVLKKF